MKEAGQLSTSYLAISKESKYLSYGE